MGFCAGLAKVFVMFINIIFAIIGIAVLAAGSWGLVKFADFEALISKPMLGFVVGVGVFIFLFSVLGAYAAHRQVKCLLIVYVFLVTIIVILELAAGIVVLVWSGRADGIKTNAVVAKSVSTVEDQILLAETCVYLKCCPFAGNVSKTLGGGFTFPDTSSEITCSKNGQVQGVNKNDAIATLALTTLSNIWTSDIRNKTNDVAAVTIPAAFCAGLILVDGTILDYGGANDCRATSWVAYVAGEDSAQADQLAFFLRLTAWITKNLTYIGGAAIGLAVTQFLCLVFSCVLMCTNKEQFEGQQA